MLVDRYLTSYGLDLKQQLPSAVIELDLTELMTQKENALWPFKMCFFVLILVMGFSPVPAFSKSQNDALTFLIYFRTTEPYAFYNPQADDFDGIVPEVLKQAAQRARRPIQFEFEERKRAEQRVYNHLADGLILSKEWAESPQQLVFSIPLFMHRAYLLSKHTFDPQDSLTDWVNGKTICTRVNYVYPQLSALFREKKAFRHDLSSHGEMLRMLSNNRCELVYMSEYRALWQLVNNKPDTRLYFSPRPVEEVAFTLALSTENQAFLEILNQYIEELHQERKIERLITEKLLPY